MDLPVARTIEVCSGKKPGPRSMGRGMALPGRLANRLASPSQGTNRSDPAVQAALHGLIGLDSTASCVEGVGLAWERRKILMP